MPNPSELERVRQENEEEMAQTAELTLRRNKAWDRSIIDYYRWQWQKFWRDPGEWFAIKIAWALPKRVALWAMIRVAAHATTGKWGDEHPDTINYPKMHDRWSQDNG